MTGERKAARDLHAAGGRPDLCTLVRKRESASGPDRFLYDGPKGRFWTTGPLEGHERSSEGSAARRLRQAAQARRTPPAPPPRPKRDAAEEQRALIAGATEYATANPKRY